MKKFYRGSIILFVCLLAAASSLHAQAAQHGILLTWTQAPTPNVTTNTLYSAPTTAGPFTLLKAIPAATSFQIALTNANGGTSACYEVSATAAGMDESALSAPVCATFPLQTGVVTGVSAVAD